MIDLKSKIGNFIFENPLMNASGVWCEDANKLDEMCQSAAGSFITKSATPKQRDGNPSPRYVEVPLGSINSMGLPNLGFDFYLNYSLNFQKKNPGKVNFLSIAGMKPEENIEMLEKINESSFAGLTELNLSCPNVPGKPQIGYDFAATEDILNKTFTFFKKPLGVKLPPYFDFVHFDEMSEILNKFPLTYVNCINSVGNGLYINLEGESVVIKPKNGFGGIGGAYVKPTALANVRAFYTRLKPEISVIGCGGVESGSDVFEHLLCGAKMVQIGSHLAKNNTQIFTQILEELQQIMNSKGYKNIEEFRGKLKSL